MLLGSASVAQAALEQREAILAETFGLYSHRHAERLLAVERAAENRRRCDTAHSKLEAAMPKLEGALKSASTKADHALLRSAQDRLKEVGTLLRAAAQRGGAASEVAAEQEAAVQAAVAKFAQRFDASQAELKQAKEQIMQLQNLLPKGHPARAHRQAPTAPAKPTAKAANEVGSSMAGKGGRAAVPVPHVAGTCQFESAEYKASAPSPSRSRGAR